MFNQQHEYMADKWIFFPLLLPLEADCSLQRLDWERQTIYCFSLLSSFHFWIIPGDVCLPPIGWKMSPFLKDSFPPSLYLKGLRKQWCWLQTLGIQVKPGEALNSQKRGQKKKKTGGEVSFNMKGKQWIRKATVRQKKGLIREICPGQGSASTRPCASRHVEITVKGLRVKGVFILFKLTSQGGKRTHSVLHSSTHKNTQCLC